MYITIYVWTERTLKGITLDQGKAISYKAVNGLPALKLCRI